MEMVEQTAATAYGNGMRNTSHRLWKWLNRQQPPLMEMVCETPATVYGNGNEQQSRVAEGVAVPSPGSVYGDTLS